jgi:hypothetical protein
MLVNETLMQLHSPVASCGLLARRADDQSVRRQDVTELLAHLVNTTVSHNSKNTCTIAKADSRVTCLPFQASLPRLHIRACGNRLQYCDHHGDAYWTTAYHIDALRDAAISGVIRDSSVCTLPSLAAMRDHGRLCCTRRRLGYTLCAA